MSKNDSRRSMRFKNLNSLAQFSSTLTEVVSNATEVVNNAYVDGCDITDTSLQSVDCWMQLKPACNGQELYSFAWYRQKKIDACFSLGGSAGGSDMFSNVCFLEPSIPNSRRVILYNQEQQDYIVNNYPSCLIPNKPRPGIRAYYSKTKL